MERIREEVIIPSGRIVLHPSAIVTTLVWALPMEVRRTLRRIRRLPAVIKRIIVQQVNIMGFAVLGTAAGPGDKTIGIHMRPQSGQSVIGLRMHHHIQQLP